MRIAYLSTFYPYRGGIAQFNAALVKEFEQKSHQVVPYTFTRQYPDLLFPGSSQYVQEDDIAELVNSIPILDTINPITYLTSASKINKYNPDVLITKFWMPFFAPSLGTVSKFLNKKTKRIAILDNVIPHEKRIGDMQLIRYFLHNTDAFVVMSNTVKNDLLSLKPNAEYIFAEHPLYNHFGEKIEIEIAKKQLGIDKNKKVLLFFGFIRDYKGLDILLEAMALLDDDYYCLIAGESYGSFDKYNDIITEKNIAHKVQKQVRYISDNEVPLFFSASDVCILPYKSATQSGIVGISYHFDLPIIATNVGGLGEMIGDKNCGLMVEEINSNSLANSIREYFKKENFVNYKLGIAKFKESANWSNFADRIMTLV